MQAKFFAGLKVVELAGVLAGPAVGMFFAELGAEVIKIENLKTGGDMTRRWRVPEEDPAAELSAYYCSINWGKQAEMLDLSAEEGRQRVWGLVRSADIVISNFKSASAQQMGMDYETLSALNPALIYAQVTAFGEADERPAFDIVLQAETGFLYMTGEPGREPVRMPVALIDILAAHQLKEGVLLALLQRERSGQGCRVSVSLLDAALASLANQAANWLMAGHEPQRMGAQHPNIAPYGDIFYGADGKALVLAVGTERQFELLCQVLGLPDLPSDPRFASNGARVAQRPALVAALATAFARDTRENWLQALHAQGVPVGSILAMSEVFQQPAAQRLVLEDLLPDGSVGRRVRTAVFGIDGGDLG